MMVVGVFTEPEDQLNAFCQLLYNVIDEIAPVKRVRDRNKPVAYLTTEWLHAKLDRDWYLNRCLL